MCGIAGFFGSTDPTEVRLRLERAAHALIHRGPDDSGFAIESDGGLAMRRLSIVGVDTGEQPIRSEDGRYALVGNGEIYNASELRERLQSRGHRFHGASDMEVVVHRFEEVGDAVFDELNGMFAIAIRDRDSGTVTVARDRVGIKPLFYAQRSGRFAFASEPTAVRAALFDDAFEIDPNAVSEFLRHGYVPGPRTWLDGVKRLPPGHKLTYRAGHLSRATWWSLPDYEPEERSSAAWAEELSALVEDSVRLRTMSDVPIGAFLSGGADSATLATVLRRALGQQFPVFTLKVGEGIYDETAGAAETARQLGVDHHIAELKIPTPDELDALFVGFGEPFADVSLLPTTRVAELASQHVKVALSGDGGDELFAGYSWLLWERRLRTLPAPMRMAAQCVAPFWRTSHRWGLSNTTAGRIGRVLSDLRSTPQAAFLRRRSLAPQGLLAALMHSAARSGDSRSSSSPSPVMPSPMDALDASSYPDTWSHLLDFDRRFYLPGTILEKVDRASMRHSLEARVPLLDHRIVEFAARIPSEEHFGAAGKGKRILRMAMERLAPTGLFDRPKRGFGLPVGEWMRGPLEGALRERLLSSSARALELFDPVAVEAVIEAHVSGSIDAGHLLWGLWSCSVVATTAGAPSAAVGRSISKAELPV